MALGPASFFTPQHYEQQRGAVSPALCELVVHCLELVARLGRQGLGFRFKGGNSLLLMLEGPLRFSIDVDIATQATREELEFAVDRIVAEADPFVRWEKRQPKTKPWLPLLSFKLFFSSVYRPADEAYVMLDAVLEPSPYPGMTRRVCCGTLYAAEQEVEVPTIDGLIGDKLLTLGPSTLGIPLGRGKEAQRLKHVFDVARLSRCPHAMELVWQSVRACQAQEERIQGRHYEWGEIAKDTLEFCGAALPWPELPDARQVPSGTYLAEIAFGFNPFREHLTRPGYAWQTFQDDCRRVMQLVESLG